MATQPDEQRHSIGDMPLNDDAFEAAPAPAPERLWGDGFAEDDGPARGIRILWIAGLVSIAWLAAAAALFWLIGQNMDPGTVTLTEWAAIAAGIFAPLTAIWLIALVVARVDPGRGRETLARLEAAEARFAASAADVRAQVDGIDHLLVAVSERMETLGASFAAHGTNFETTTARATEVARAISGGLAEDREKLEELISRLAERGEVTHSRLGELAAILPDAEVQATRIGAALQDHGDAALRRIDDFEARLSALDERERMATQGAMQRGASANELLSHIDQTARDVEGLMGERRAELSSEIDAVLARTASTLEEHRGLLASEIDGAAARTALALDQTRGELNAEIDNSLARTAETLERARTGLGAQADAINAAIEQANLSLEDTGRTAAEQIETRLSGLAARAETLALEFGKQDERSAAMFDASDERFTALERRLGEAAAQGESVLSGYESRIETLRGGTVALAAPVAETRDLISSLEGSVNLIRVQLGETLVAFETQLPDLSAARQTDLSNLNDRVAALRNEFAELGTQAETLSAPVETARASIASTVSDLHEARRALETTTDKLNTDLADASASLDATRELAEGTALGAASQLIEALGRVREVAGQASESVRSTLAGVVDEAVEAIGRASSDTVRASALQPVEEQIMQLEAVGKRSANAANEAAERLSRALVSVAETAAAVEARVKEADAHLDGAQKNDLSQQSNLLIEALNSNAIDITKTLSTEVTEAAWREYSGGDRSVFTRRASRLVENATAKEIARHYEDEPEFRDAVRRYIHDFEAMMRRVMKDRDGDSFSIALLSSDVGKLYVALAQSTDRLRAKG
ncbi:MAG: hypothetical protein WA979_14255 [Pacificimonas sp.]